MSRYISKSARTVASYSTQNHIGSLKPIADSFYFDHENYWEPNVVLACRDVLKPGDVFWDIGANMGGVTRLASRLVGPKGKVISIEASLNNYRKLNHNTVVNHLSNVFLIRAAIWNEGGKTLTLHNGSGGDDSLFPSDHLVTSTESVESLTLDALFKLYGMPNLMKMDIEGAEYEALMGAENILKLSSESNRPIIILESSSKDVRALQLLKEKAYILQDLATGVIWKDFTISHSDPISNWLAIPEERESEFIQHLIPFSEFQCAPKNIDSNIILESLPKGRYRVDIDIEPFVGESIFVNIYNNDVLISRYHGDANWLQDSYRCRQFDFKKTGKLTIAIVDPTGGDKKPNSNLLRIKLLSKEGFEIQMDSYVIAP